MEDTADVTQESAAFTSYIQSSLQKALRKIGFVRPTPIQQRCIPLALEGKDVLARARTGSGKTLAYAVPILDRIIQAKKRDGTPCTRAVVLLPSRELCNQVYEVFERFRPYCNVHAHFLQRLGGRPGSSMEGQVTLTTGAPPDVLIATPSVLLSAASASGQVLERLEMLVLDEADLLASYGHSDDLSALAARLPAGVQSMLVSATLDEDISALQNIVLHNPVVVQLDEPAAGANLDQRFVICPSITKRYAREGAGRYHMLYTLLVTHAIQPPALFFVNTTPGCFRIKLYLDQFGIRVAVLNPLLPVNSRLHTIKQFTRGVFDYLIATDESFKTSKGPQGESTVDDKGRVRARRDKTFNVARGLDFRSVQTVVSLEPPATTTDYIHRVGRTARYDGAGTSFLLVTDEDKDAFQSIKKTVGDDLQEFHVPQDTARSLVYRCNEAINKVTRGALKTAMEREIKLELVNNAKLKEHFSANPSDLVALKDNLRHDLPLIKRRHARPELHTLPQYIRESGAIGLPERAAEDLKAKTQRKRSARSGKSKGDPLTSFMMGGKGHKSQGKRTKCNKRPRKGT